MQARAHPEPRPMRRRITTLRLLIVCAWGASGYDQCIFWFEAYVLSGILPFDHIVVVETDARLRAIHLRPQNINRLLLREIPEAARDCDRVENSGGVRQKVGSWPDHLSKNVESLTLHFLHDYSHVRIGDIGLQLLLQSGLQLTRRLPTGLHFADQWEGHLPIRTHGNGMRDFWLLPDIDSQDISRTDYETIVNRGNGPALVGGRRGTAIVRFVDLSRLSPKGRRQDYPNANPRGSPTRLTRNASIFLVNHSDTPQFERWGLKLKH